MASLEEFRKIWEEAFNRGDLSAIGELYATDARYYTSDGKVDEGREAIVKARQKEHDDMLRALGIRTIQSKIVKHERMELGETAVEIGGFTLTSDGKEVNRGFYMGVARKVGGEWMLVRHMATSLQPTPAQQEGLMAGMA
jgi:ketosteroid isomerase-like protein